MQIASMYLTLLSFIWSLAVLQSAAGRCINPGTPPGSTRHPANQLSFETGNTVTYTCMLGHMMHGYRTLQCLPSGDWSFELPVCVANERTQDRPETAREHPETAMERPETAREHPETAAERSETADRERPETADREHRYTTTTTAAAERLQSTTPPPPCPAIVAPYNGSVSSPARGQVTYRCDVGYVLHAEDEGVSNNIYNRECQRDGTWSGRQPWCEEYTCTTPITPQEGSVYFSGDSSRFEVNRQIFYMCKPGYRLVGRETRRCKLNYGWTGRTPYCTALYCPAPELEHGRLMPNKNIYYPGDLVRFDCYQDYRRYGPRSMTCTDQYAWSTDDIAVCRFMPIEAPCVDQGIAPGGVREITNTRRTVFARYRCHHGLLLEGRSRLRCNKRTGQWNGAPPICKSEHRFRNVSVEANRLVAALQHLLAVDSGAKPLVLYILIDLSGSQSIGQEQSRLNFLKAVLNRIYDDPSAERVYISLITFTNVSQVVIYPWQRSELDTVLGKLIRLKTREEGTNIRAALSLVLDLLNEGETKTGWSSVQRASNTAVVMVTDAEYNIGGSPTDKGIELKARGSHLFLLSISQTANNQRLQDIVPPENVFYLYQGAAPIATNFTVEPEDFSKCGISNVRSCSEEMLLNEATLKAHPWTVAIYWSVAPSARNADSLPQQNDKLSGYQFSQTGVIIGTQWVLTAAAGNQRQWTNKTGLIVYGEGEGVIVVVEKVFEKTELGSTMLLLKLATPIEFCRYTRAICYTVPIDGIDNQNFFDKGEDTYSLTRIGSVSSWRYNASRGQQPLIESACSKIKACSDRNGDVFCADGEQYDAGSTFSMYTENALDHKDRRYVISGLRVNTNDEHEQPFVRVAKFSRWIRDQVKNETAQA